MKKLFSFVGGVMILVLMAGALWKLYQPSIEPNSDSPVACTMEAKICPDGSAVGRTGPNCEFAPCPASDELPVRYGEDVSKMEEYRNDCQVRGGEFNECGSACGPEAEVCIDVCSMICEVPKVEPVVVECTPDMRAKMCPEIYAPVCASVQVQCVTTPCPPLEETYSNSCFACSDNNVVLYTEGACEAEQLYAI